MNHCGVKLDMEDIASIVRIIPMDPIVRNARKTITSIRSPTNVSPVIVIQLVSLLFLFTVHSQCQLIHTGSISLQCSGNGQCACKNGVDGKQCDRCAANYFDFGHNGCR